MGREERHSRRVERISNRSSKSESTPGEETVDKQTTSCKACGSDAPKSAKFCPNCGFNLDDEEEMPVAEAVAVNENVPIFHMMHETTTRAAATQAGPAETKGNLDTPTTAGADDDANKMRGALYFKNPTPDMLQHAYIQRAGGILFVQSPDYFKGKCTLAKTVHVGRVMGGDKINLSKADFLHSTTTIIIGVLMGGVKVIVPRGVRVECQGIGIMGHFHGIRSQNVNAGQEAPKIVVKGLSIMGSVDVEVNEDVPPIQTVVLDGDHESTAKIGDGMFESRHDCLFC